jgi:exopolysaccharide biosynthesis protein
LIRDGKVETTEVAEKFKPDVVRRGPRTALGVDKEGNCILLVADGWQENFEGLTLPETAQELAKLGAVNAMNLDGGNSTALAVNGELTNHPVAESEVPVANALMLRNPGK